MPDDPNWPRASRWLAAPGIDFSVIGLPSRLGSISGGRFDLAPSAIRGVLERFSVWDGQRDLRQISALDHGDIDIADDPPEPAFRRIYEEVAEAEASVSMGVVVALGGENSVTRPAVRAIADRTCDSIADIGVVTLDAHHDLRDTSEGLLNGNPIRALLEDGLHGRNVAQIGIQPFANSPVYAAIARDEGIHVSTMDEVRTRGIDALMSEALDDLSERCDAIYVDLDIDVLDRAFAPACPGSRPGGLMPWELHHAAFLAGAHPKVAGVDIVEVDPERDVADVTVMNAARCLLSFAAGLASRKHNEAGRPAG